MAKHINYKAEFSLDNNIFLIKEKITDNNDLVSFEKILDNVETLKNTSDLFLQSVIDQNNFLILSGNKKIEGDEDENADDP